MNRTDLQAHSFSVAVQIYGITNIWLMAVRYVAIDKAFPHRLNSFDNIPINYGSGPIVNITIKTTNFTSYSNILNFTSQSIASGLNFTSFQTPFNRNKIILFTTSLFIAGTFGLGGSGENEIDINVET